MHCCSEVGVHTSAPSVMLACRSWKPSLCSAVCGVWGPVLSRGLAVRIATGDSGPLLCLPPQQATSQAALPGRL